MKLYRTLTILGAVALLVAAATGGGLRTAPSSAPAAVASAAEAETGIAEALGLKLPAPSATATNQSVDSENPRSIVAEQKATASPQRTRSTVPATAARDREEPDRVALAERAGAHSARSAPTATAVATASPTPLMTPEEIAAAQAVLRDAQARMSRARTQFRLQAIAAAEAELRKAEADLERAREASPDESELKAARTALGDAESGLQRLTSDQGAGAEVAAAEAALAEADARLQGVRAGPDPQVLADAQQQLENAQRNFDSVAGQASAAKTAAEQLVAALAEQLRLEQETYSQAYWQNEQALGGIDPASGRSFDDADLDAEAQKQHYAALLATAGQQLQGIQAKLAEAQAGYEGARQQEIELVSAAQAHLDNARAKLAAAQQGPPPENVTQAQAAVERARMRLDAARRQLETVTRAQSEAQVRLAQEQKHVAELEHGGNPQAVAEAQAKVDAARARLAQVRRAGTGNGGWSWPSFGTITSGFGKRDLSVSPFHNGLDIAGPEGTPIGAAYDGVVIEAGWCRAYGYCVKLAHGGGLVTEYGHMAEPPPVKNGDKVTAGTIVGVMGTTYDRSHGGYSTGVHLHFTVRVNGNAVDPLLYLP